MKLRRAFAESLRTIRNAQGMSQEDFSEVSSRVYISLLEREKKSPTLDKIDELASRLQVHPLTLLTLTYMQKGDLTAAALQDVVRAELSAIAKNASGSNRRDASRTVSRKKLR